MEGALTGGLWYNWFSKLEKHVAPTDRRAPVVFKPAPGLGARTASVVEGAMTLDGLTQSARHQYLLDNVFVFLDKIQTRWSIPAGSVVRVRSLLKQALQHGLDESKLDELQLLANAIQITEAPMCISCKAFNGRVRRCSTLRCMRRRVITPVCCVHHSHSSNGCAESASLATIKSRKLSARRLWPRLQRS